MRGRGRDGWGGGGRGGEGGGDGELTLGERAMPQCGRIVTRSAQNRTLVITMDNELNMNNERITWVSNQMGTLVSVLAVLLLEQSSMSSS